MMMMVMISYATAISTIYYIFGAISGLILFYLILKLEPFVRRVSNCLVLGMMSWIPWVSAMTLYRVIDGGDGDGDDIIVYGIPVVSMVVMLGAWSYYREKYVRDGGGDGDNRINLAGGGP